MYSGGPPTSTSGLAVASMVLGILALLLFFTHVFAFLLALLAIIFGHISRGTIHRSGGRIGGAGMSLAGLITGYIALIIVTVILIALGFFVKAAYDEAKSNPEVRNKFEEVFREAQRELDKQKEKAPE